MKLSQIKKIRDTFRGKAILEVTLDNLQIFGDGREGQVVLWDDKNEIVTCIRENVDDHQQHINPWQIMVSAYDHIQFIDVRVNLKGIETYLNAVGYPKAAELTEFFANQHVAKSSITGSTGDGIEWPTQKDGYPLQKESESGTDDAGSGEGSSSGDGTVIDGDGDVDDDI